MVLVDPAPAHALGRGAAYRTTDPTHLLNSRAAAMSALADAPTDFVDWCREQGLPIGPADFAPRAVFGDYLHDRLSRVEFEHVRGVAIRLEHGAREHGAWCCAAGSTCPPTGSCWPSATAPRRARCPSPRPCGPIPTMWETRGPRARWTGSRATCRCC